MGRYSTASGRVARAVSCCPLAAGVTARKRNARERSPEITAPARPSLSLASQPATQGEEGVPCSTTPAVDRSVGSRTSPPCDPTTWFVMTQPLYVTTQQVQQFSKLLSSDMFPQGKNARSLQETGSEREATYYYGARSEADLFHLDELASLPCEFVPALSEDDWAGESGLITDVVDRLEADVTEVDA